VTWAFSHERVERIMAETYPEFVASVRVLEKHGFQVTCRGGSSHTIRFELRRSVFEGRSLNGQGPKGPRTKGQGLRAKG
jgi:RimJ/RimL family protein N-acetyltransferase